MGLLSIIRKIKKKEKEMRVLMVGLDNSGKTTIVLKLNGEDTSVISPTLGFNIKTITYSKYVLNIWDVGGQKTIRSYWRNYFEQTDGLVWVVDSSDLRRLDDCKFELDNLLKEEDLRRLAAYARSSSNLLTKLILQDQLDSYGWECIFRTPLNNFDAVILLHRDKLAYPERLLFPSELNQGKLVVQAKASKFFHPFISSGDMKANIEELRRKLMVDFDPSRCLIEDLERRFPDTFKVWYDSLGGDAIGVTWKQEGLKKRGRDAGKEEQNLLDELKAVGHVGKGFVRRIYSLKAPRLN